MKTKQWLKRQKNDPFVIKAQKKGYLSRASFKLIEIENKYNLIKKSDRIIDLGSSPGSWSQVVVEYNNNAKITAIDLLEMKFHHKNIEFIKNDFTKINFNSFKEKFDLILSDLAPNTTGHQSTDHLKISAYVLNVISIIDIIANQNSNFITKIWKGSEEKLILKELESKFKNVSYFKPNSSRKNSSEIYLIAQNFN
tara:strand:- start:3955 stop:4542 length:588 start_codon:yes stop_codon:yes gene_type:complete